MKKRIELLEEIIADLLLGYPTPTSLKVKRLQAELASLPKEQSVSDEEIVGKLYEWSDTHLSQEADLTIADCRAIINYLKSCGQEKPMADMDSIIRWLDGNGIKGEFNYVSLTQRYLAGLIQGFISQWVLPIPKTIEFPNDTHELSVTETCNKVITEIDKCECGHIAPVGFIYWNQDGDSTCVNCVNDILIDRLDKKNKQIKRLKATLNVLIKK